MNPLTKLRDLFRPAEPAPVYDPVAADREYRERMGNDWRFRQAEQDRQVEELTASMPLAQARELFAREQRFELDRIACDHDHQSDCDACEAAYEREYGPVPPEYEASEIRRSAVSRIMTRDDPDAVAAAAQAIHQAQERAGAARAEVIARARRGMTYGEARALLRKQDEYDYVGADGLDSRQVEAARRVVASGANYAISRTQPLPVVPARLGAAGDNAALLLLRAEDAAAERALAGACAAAGADPEDPRVAAAEERLTVARRDLQTAEGQAAAGRDVNAWWLDELGRKAHRASDELDYLRNHPTLPGAAAAIERTEAERAGAVWDRQAAVQALASAADRLVDRSAGRVFEDGLTEEAEARRQLDEALDAGAPGAVLDQAEARWQAAVHDRDAAGQAVEGAQTARAQGGPEPAESVVVEELEVVARPELPLSWLHVNEWQSELSHAELGEVKQMDAKLYARHRQMMDQVFGRENLPDAVEAALTDAPDQPSPARDESAAEHAEHADGYGADDPEYDDYEYDPEYDDMCGRLTPLELEGARLTRERVGDPGTEPASMRFGFVAPPQPGGETVRTAVESAQDAVNNLSAQPPTTADRAEYGRVHTDRWAGDQHEYGDQRGAGYGAEYGGGLADGRGVGW